MSDGLPLVSAPVLRPGILDIAPYVGGDSHIPGVERVIKLASNEGALGPSPAAMKIMRDSAGRIHRYPDGSCAALRQAIGRRWGLSPDRIVCGAGSDELIALLIRAYAGPGDEVIQSRHGFLIYSIAARAVGARPVMAPEIDLTADVDALLAAVTPRTRMVFLANPNNPTGTCLSADEVRRLHAGLPGTVMFVLDAAYAEYVDRNDYDPGIDLAGSTANVVMLRTFSKLYALGGMRIGWAYGPAAVMDALNRIRGPFNVGSVASEAAIAALEDIEFTDRCLRHNAQWRAWFTDALTEIGVDVVPSLGNFVLARFGSAAAAEAADASLRRSGIIVRRVGAYGLPDCLRITIGTETEMRATMTVLTDFKAGK